MHLIANGTQVASLPAPRTPVGTPGYAFNGDPGTGVPTVFDPDMGNTLIEEIRRVVAKTGIALDYTNNAQFLQAIARIAASHSAYATANVTLTVDDAGLVQINAGSNDVTVTLPLSAGANGVPIRYRIVRMDSSGHVVFVNCVGSDIFYPGSGLQSLALAQFDTLDLISDGVTYWHARGAALPAAVAFTASGTYTSPYLPTLVEWETLGGGAGGADGLGGATFGGGAGGYGRGIALLTANTSVPVTVGAGGAGGVTGSPGGNGGTSSFGTYGSAPGGFGARTGGAGGVGGYLSIAGGNGDPGSISLNIPGCGGSPAMYGQGGRPTYSGAGNPGSGFGAGGAGGGPSQNGGAGTGGLVIVRAYKL